MIKLSKSGWNNVIIFVVMGFILLINVVNKNTYSPDAGQADIHANQALTILGENQVVLTLSIENVVLVERIARTWRARPASIAGQALEQMMMSWQQSSGELMMQAPEIDRQFALNVTLDIAGKSQPLQLNVYATEQQLLVFNQNTQQWLALPIEMYGQLFPQEIFAN